MKTIIIGAGGLGKLVLDYATSLGHKIIGFLDDNEALAGEKIHGIPVLGKISLYQELSKQLPIAALVAVRSNINRMKIFQSLDMLGFTLDFMYEDSGNIFEGLKIGRGSIIFPPTVISSDTVLGDNCIIDSMCKIGHDCMIRDHCYLESGIIIGNLVCIEERVTIGAGAIIASGITIAKDSNVLPGSVVIDNVPEKSNIAGNPARIIK